MTQTRWRSRFYAETFAARYPGAPLEKIRLAASKCASWDRFEFSIDTLAIQERVIVDLLNPVNVSVDLASSI